MLGGGVCSSERRYDLYSYVRIISDTIAYPTVRFTISKKKAREMRLRGAGLSSRANGYCDLEYILPPELLLLMGIRGKDHNSSQLPTPMDWPVSTNKRPERSWTCD